MNKKTNSGLKIICLNRKASFNYFFEDLLEAGIVLKGSEIKSIREGKVNIADSYAVEKDGELILINSHIASYKQASYSNHNPTDERKLLLNKREINKLIGKIEKDGLTIVPTKMYFKKGKAKIELAVAKGKKLHDKRASKKDRDWNRDKSRYFRKSS
ncbi:SsrA-binding protein SmpB [Candidatus Pelagibacter sp. RS39]|uniref:SsrA-binding protein SmpB n=1 Tax=Candidatus Pelagibacter sp. RS39 TaxID=1977864 RepID=UPI000A157381|nr:SsrA-binding protein SmpB [Candidatus Pelagibacter sp. RS39]ARJ47918.1 SsrA-binding protein [Candidatus Pelagibacter sp. RS39]